MKVVYWVDSRFDSSRNTNRQESYVRKMLELLCDRFAHCQIELNSKIYQLGNSSRRYVIGGPTLPDFFWRPAYGHRPHDAKYEISLSHRGWAPGAVLSTTLVVVAGALDDGDYSEKGRAGSFISNTLEPEKIPYIRYSDAPEFLTPASQRGLRFIRKPNLSELVNSIIELGF